MSIIKEVDKLSCNFLKTPSETNAINLLRCIRSNNMFSLSMYIGEYLMKLFPYKFREIGNLYLITNDSSVK